MGSEATHPLDKRGSTIRDMFAGVAPRYDLLNRLISAFLDEGWRRRAAAALGSDRSSAGAVDRGSAPPGPILDLCCGTGDQSRAVYRWGRGERRVAAVDFTLPMLTLARRKLSGLGAGSPKPMAADALELPFSDDAFAGAVVSFGLRNVADLDRALAELSRAIAPGGHLVVLEAAVPGNRLVRPFHQLYCRWLLPGLGALLSPRGSAYRYLPASVVDFPSREAFLGRMAAAGFTDLTYQDLSMGAVCLYVGVSNR